MATYQIEVKRFFVDSGKCNKKGNALLIPITHRKMYIQTKPFLDCGKYRIVYKKGLYTISTFPKKEQPWWTNPKGVAEVWYSYSKEYARTDDKPMNEEAITKWLSVRIGAEKARIALYELKNNEPEAAAEAA